MIYQTAKQAAQKNCGTVHEELNSLLDVEDGLAQLIRRVSAAEAAIRSEDISYNDDARRGIADILSVEIDRLKAILSVISDCRDPRQIQ